MFQTKEQVNSQEQLSEVEIGNLPEKEFRVMIVNMIQDLRKRMVAQTEKIQEMFNKELEDSKNKQMNSTISEMKNTLVGINSRINEGEEQISKLEDRMVEITAVEQNKERRMKRNGDSVRDLWHNIKHTNICIIGVSEGGEREWARENIQRDYSQKLP